MSVLTVQTGSVTLPQSTTVDLFDVNDGLVLLQGIVGHVDTAIGSAGTATLVAAPQSGTLTNVTLLSTSLNSVSVNSLIGVSTALAVTPVGAGLVLNGNAKISFTCTGSATGAITWTLFYKTLRANQGGVSGFVNPLV